MTIYYVGFEKEERLFFKTKAKQLLIKKLKKI